MRDAAMLLESWEPYGALVFGLGGVAMGILFRLGHLRTMARWYHKRHLPFYVRNLPFTTIPYGLMFLAAFSAFALADGGLELAAGYVAVSSLLFVLLGIGFSVRPPEFLKPTWLRRGGYRAARLEAETWSNPG
jgi:hypothetical protein